MTVHTPFSPLDSGSRIPNLLFDPEHGYDEEVALLAEMKALKARAAVHCANADKKKFRTQTTAFIRDIVQHLPENPMQVPGARSLIHANLVGRLRTANVPVLMPLPPTPGRPPNKGHNTIPGSFRDNLRVLAESGVPLNIYKCHAELLAAQSNISTSAGGPCIPPQPNIPAPASAFLGTPPAWSASAPSASAPSTPRGQKRARVEDGGDDGSPRARRFPTPDVLYPNTPEPRVPSTPEPRFSSTPDTRLNSTPDPRFTTARTPEPRYTSTPDARFPQTPEPYFSFTTTPDLRSPTIPARYPHSPDASSLRLFTVPGPPDTPSPRKSANTGTSYLSSTFRARRTGRTPGRPSVLPFSALGLDAEEIPRFLEGI